MPPVGDQPSLHRHSGLITAGCSGSTGLTSDQSQSDADQMGLKEMYTTERVCVPVENQRTEAPDLTTELQ